MNESTDESQDARIVHRLRLATALLTGLLVASTWPLWTPGTALPDVPWFAWAVDLPPESWDWLWLASLGGLLASQFVPRSFNARRWTAARCALFGLALLLLPTDQHRLQPWVWQMLIVGAILGVSPRDRLAIRLVRAFTISIYFWSAVSKIDMAFVAGHGQVLLNGLLASVGQSADMLSPPTRRCLAATFPMGELLVAVLLCFPWSRPCGRAGAMAMHVLLLLTLGPLGLNHERGVLFWNLLLIVDVWILFGRQPTTSAAADDRNEWRTAQPQAWFVVALTSLVCGLPALSLAGRWDWWPSWAVYSSRPAIVRMFVDEGDVERLPRTLQPDVGPPRPLSSWRPVNLDGWSFETCWCPMYPQERYRLAVARAMAKQAQADVQVTIRSSPDRWTGRRTETTLDAAALNERMQTFWFNTLPRDDSPRDAVD